MIQANINIDAPPRIVREIFLDFPNLSTWHDKSFFLDIKVVAPASKTTGFDLQRGDKIQLVIPGGTFPGIIEDNEPHRLSWIGSVPYVFTGKHNFDFTSDPTDANKTLFSQSEDFSGILSFMMLFFKEKTLAGWKRANEDLKKAAEKKWVQEQAGL